MDESQKVLKDVENLFFALLCFEIGETKGCDDVKNLITPEKLRALYKLSKQHDLAHLIGDALDKGRLFMEELEVKKHFLQERNLAVYRYEQMRYELEQICEVLEKAKVPFITLKGSVIRQFYPEPWMRTSCDIDILVQKDYLLQASQVLIEELHYQEKGMSDHDVHLYSISGVHLELHYSLFENSKNSELFSSLWNNASFGKYQFQMSAEILYFYHIAHMAKHFEIGGCGVRPFLDIYFLRKHSEYCTEECYALLKKGRLLTFARAVEETTAVWFESAQETEISQDIKNYILHAGMYADTENRVAVQHIKKGGHFKYLCSRIFLPYENLKFQYPNLQKRKWLLPFYQVKRWCRLLFGKDSKNVSRELKANINLRKDKKERIAKLLKDLDL